MRVCRAADSGVVLLVPPPVAHEVDGLRRALGDGVLGRVPPHITLIPPVNVREEDLGDALAVVREAAAATGPLTLDLGPVETFLPVNPVVYLEVGGPSLPTVHALYAALLVGPFERPPVHEFVPHVTVAEALDEDRIPVAMAALSGYRHTIVNLRLLHVLQEVRDDEDQRVWRPSPASPSGRPSVVGRGGLELVIEVHDRVPPDAGALGAERGPADVVLVARREGAVVGLLGGRIRGAKAWLEWVEVDSGADGGGRRYAAPRRLRVGRRRAGRDPGLRPGRAGGPGGVLPGRPGLVPRGPPADGAGPHRPGGLSRAA